MGKREKEGMRGREDGREEGRALERGLCRWTRVHPEG